MPHELQSNALGWC